MDVIYPYKRSPGDFELRYSLRSLQQNVPHGRVIIAGDLPFETSESVITVPNPRVSGDRFASSTSNILAALDKADVSGEFIVMNDDIFVLQPWTFQHEDRGPLDTFLSHQSVSGEYRSRLLETLAILRSHGVAKALFYGLHTPTVYDRSKLAVLMREFPMPRYRYLLRTLYNNLFFRPSIRRDDVKLKSWPPAGDVGDVLSISDDVATMPAFREWIDSKSPVPSVYEVA